MKGSTHLAIGTAIGIAAAAYYPFTFQNAALYISVAGFSALSADLDSRSILSSKLSKLSKLLHELFHWGGISLVIACLYLYFVRDFFDLTLTCVSIMIFLIGFITKEGIIRNTLVTLVGLGIIYTGSYWKLNWLMGSGLFISWAPWLKHRGMTHTIWAALIWGSIGYGMQNQLQVEGLMLVSFTSYLSHLVADTMTPAGVKWFYPLYKKAIK